MPALSNLIGLLLRRYCFPMLVSFFQAGAELFQAFDLFIRLEQRETLFFTFFFHRPQKHPLRPKSTIELLDKLSVELEIDHREVLAVFARQAPGVRGQASLKLLQLVQQLQPLLLNRRKGESLRFSPPLTEA
jgi:hypothetical protein